MRTPFPYILIFFILISCAERPKEVDQTAIPASTGITDTTSSRKKSTASVLDIVKFKFQLDSLLKQLKGDKHKFELNIDTFNYKNTDIKTLEFRSGLFRDLDCDSIENVICNYFFVPHTKLMLRVYLIEADFSSKQSLRTKIDELKVSMYQREEAFMDCGMHVRHGLTPLHDYVMTHENKLYWLNLGYTYSQMEFRQFIQCLRNNVDTTLFKGEILCYFSGKCTDQNVP